jgi:3',5'-cyclic AMP phosphodiesterase CpdA
MNQMPPMKQFRNVHASLWQSAVDQVIAQKNAGRSPAAHLGAPSPAGPVVRPDPSTPEILQTNDIAEAIDAGQSVPLAPAPSPAAGFAGTVKFCSAAAFKLAEARVKAFFTGDASELNLLKAQLDTPFAQCDPQWVRVLEVYVASRIADKTIPYRRHASLGDFVIDDRLPAQANVALLADWGTGQDSARKLLTKLAAHRPDVVLHLGDVYYSGTQNEVQNYFYAIWQKVLGLPAVAWGEKYDQPASPKKPATFHLAGNHDMYSGGHPYYTVIDMLGQPASYFCLRNEHWQFLTLDTGLHDANPSQAGQPTWLEDSEVAWLKDKVNNAGGRKTILLSHHQLFTAYERIGNQAVNQRLLAQLHDILPKVTAWFWGHEHNLVIYQPWLNVLARCIGNGAFPVLPSELASPNPEVPLDPVTLAKDKSGFFAHGYVTMQIDGAAASVTYYQYDDAADTESVLFTETL